MRGKNPSFEKINIVETSWINNKINILAYLTLDGKIKAGGLYYGKKINPLKEEIIKKYLEVYFLLDPQVKNVSGYSGISFFDGMPVILAIHPVLKSDLTGSVAGYLIMGRFIDEAKLKFIKNLFGLNLFKIFKSEDFSEIKNITLPERIPKIIKETHYGNHVVINIKDFTGSFIVLSLEVPKKISAAEKYINIMMLNHFFISVLYGFILYIIVSKLLISKLSRIIKGIKEIKENKKELIKITGKDELCFLAEEINKFFKEIKNKEELYKTLAEKSNEIIALFNRNFDLIYINPAGKKYLDLLEENIYPMLTESLSLKENEKIEKEISLPRGMLIKGVIQPLEGEDRKILFLGQDITPYVYEKEILLDMTRKDYITGMYEKDYIEEKLGKINALAKKGKKYAFLLIKVENLDKIKDTGGFMAKNEILIKISQQIKNSLRKNDISAKLKDDEFGIILKVEDDENIVDRISESIISVYPSISIGLASIEGNESLDKIIQKAKNQKLTFL